MSSRVLPAVLIADVDSPVLNPWLPAALPALGADGATLGQRAVRLKRIRADGGRPGIRILPALAGGTFGYFVLPDSAGTPVRGPA